MKVLRCVKVGSNLKVEVVGEKGFVQFPKDLREEGKMFAADLTKSGNFWKVQGEIFNVSSLSKKETQSEENEYVHFVENNDNEGESWNFFVSVNDPRIEQLKKMVDLNDKNSGGEGEFSYEKETLSESEIKVFLKSKGSTSYINQYNLCEISEDIPSLSEVPNLSADAIYQTLYKFAPFCIIKEPIKYLNKMKLKKKVSAL